MPDKTFENKNYCFDITNEKTQEKKENDNISILINDSEKMEKTKQISLIKKEIEIYFSKYLTLENLTIILKE